MDNAVECREAALVRQSAAMRQWVREEDRLRSAGLVLLVLLAAFLPFELKVPLLHVGPISITSVEICIYLAVGAWGLCRLARRTRGWTAAHVTVAAWAGVLIWSALLAPAFGTEAFKFALRGLGGCALFFAAADFVRTPGTAATVGLAMLSGACLSAAAAFAEAWWPGAAAFLANFKTGPSMSGGYLRASGTFQYANIGSMFWESALPLAFAVPAWWGRRQGSRPWLWAGAAACLILVEAIFLAASRAGIVIAILLFSLAPLIARDSLTRLKPVAGICLFSIILLLMVQLAADPLFSLRLTTRDTSSWYRAGFAGYPERLTISAGRTIKVPLSIRNEGRLTWQARGKHAVAVSYHWLDPEATRILIWQGARSELPSDVAPGTGIRINPWIIAPGEPGRYTLQWDLLQENIAWFSTFGPSASRMEVEILPPAVVSYPSAGPPPIDLPLPTQPARLDLWRAAVRMFLDRPLLGVGPDNFRHLYGRYLGLKSSDDRVYANNHYLEVLADTGLAGFVVWMAILAAVAARLRTAWRSTRFPDDRLLLAGAGIALGVSCLHGTVDYFLAFSPSYGQFWILAGTIAGMASGGESR